MPKIANGDCGCGDERGDVGEDDDDEEGDDDVQVDCGDVMM